MNATEAMERIEGHAFSALVNLASDFPTFLRILTSQPEVRALADEMKSERITLDVFARVGELAAKSIEEEYEHPADSALAAYLWMLCATNGDYSEKAATTVLECKQCWWARKMAEYVHDSKQSEKHQPEKGAEKNTKSLLRSKKGS